MSILVGEHCKCSYKDSAAAYTLWDNCVGYEYTTLRVTHRRVLHMLTRVQLRLAKQLQGSLAQRESISEHLLPPSGSITPYVLLYTLSGSTAVLPAWECLLMGSSIYICSIHSLCEALQLCCKVHIQWNTAVWTCTAVPASDGTGLCSNTVIPPEYR